MNRYRPHNWDIEEPRLLPGGQVQVIAWQHGGMIARLDGELDADQVTVTMVYVSPPWRGSGVLHDMLAALKLLGLQKLRRGVDRRRRAHRTMLPWA